MCNASKQQKEAYANEEKLSNELGSIVQQFYGQNQAMLNETVSSLTPIEAAGPSQFGFAAPAEAAMRTSATENIAAAGSEAANAVRSSLAAKGALPSGSEAAILGQLAQQNAVQQALAQAQITEQGYETGRQNWQFATAGLEKAPGAYETPVTQAGGVATSAAGQAMQGADAITQAQQAWVAPAAGIIGAGLKLATGGLASATPSPTPTPVMQGGPNSMSVG